MSLPKVIHADEQAVYANDSTRKLSVGQRVETPNGRVFRYALAGGADLVASKLQSSSTALGHANNDTLAVATSCAVGDNTLAITNGATTWTLDELKGGLLVNERKEELGAHSWIIYGNTAEATGSSAMTLTLTPGVTFDTVLTAGTSVVAICPSIYSKVVVYPLTPAGIPAGVAMRVVTTTYYGYLQTHGIGSIILDSGGTGTPVLGEGCATSDAITGGFGNLDVDVNHAQLGIWANIDSDDGDHVAVYLMID